jgi:hypothetical protein
LATLGGVIMYLSRPPSADKLYAAISARVDTNDDSSLGRVESEVNDFLERFPADSRAELLKSYQEQIELDKLERKLQRQTRGGGAFNTSLLPAEQLYLDAAVVGASSPEKAIDMLGALVNLYDPDVPIAVQPSPQSGSNKKNLDRDTNERTADVVQLAKRRIQGLQADMAKQRSQQLAAINERLVAAERIQSTKPEQASAVFRAIISLHENDDWAKETVAKARNALASTEKK